MHSRMARRVFAATSLGVLLWSGSASAATEDEQRGIDPSQGKSLAQLTLPSKSAAMRLQLDADRYGIEFNDHYLRKNRDGTVTVHVFGSDADLDRLEDGGFAVDQVLEGPRTWRAQTAARPAAVRNERAAIQVVEDDV